MRTKGVRVELIRKFKEKTIENYVEYANNYGASKIYYFGEEMYEAALTDGKLTAVKEL